MPEISIIIPTLNEEELLPRLLDSIKQQTFTNYEVIVADAGSKDRTAELATELGAKVVAGGMPGPGRNRGAEAATGNFLFFFDADVRLPKDFLEKALAEMNERFLDMATCEFLPESDYRLDKVMFKIANLTVKLNQDINPRAAGFCIFITKRLFDRIGGFDEEVTIAEDHDLVERASKFRKLGFLNTVKLSVSIRRLVKEGRFSLVEKYMQVEMHLLTKGSVKDNLIEYEFGNFSEDQSNEGRKLLDDMEEQIIKFEDQYNDATRTFRESELNERIKDMQEKWKNNISTVRESVIKLFKIRKQQE